MSGGSREAPLLARRARKGNSGSCGPKLDRRLSRRTHVIVARTYGGDASEDGDDGDVCGDRVEAVGVAGISEDLRGGIRGVGAEGERRG